MSYIDHECSYVYLLRIEGKDYFKIGQSVNVEKRINQLSRNGKAFVPVVSFKIKCTLKDIFKFEKALHFMFKPYNVDDKLIRGWHRTVEGESEWFYDECYDDVIEMIKKIGVMRADAVGNIEKVGV